MGFWGSRRVVAGLVTVALLVAGVVAFKMSNVWQESAASAKTCELVRSTEDRVSVLRAESAGRAPRVAVLGDSFAEGLYLDDPMDAYPYLLGSAVSVDGAGGSGYVAEGPCGEQALSSRLSRALSLEPELLIVQAGINDRGLGRVDSAVFNFYSRVQAEAPKMRVVVVGPFAPPAIAGPGIDAVAETLRAEAKRRGYVFVDPRGWDFDRLSDGLHPSAAGHRQIAERLAPLIR